MIHHWKTTGFRMSCLAAMAGLCLTQTGYALESLSDDRLAETTGEGIALLPENFKMVFQGPNDQSATSSYNRSNITDAAKYDTGFIRIIPTGENYEQLKLTAAQAAAMHNKADIFIYGLALSKSNSDLNQRFSNQGFNWGDAANPWLFRAGTATNIKQFAAKNPSGDISYLALEAPLVKVNADESDNNIKLGFWLDAFSRSWDSSNTLNPITGAPIPKPTSDGNDQDLDRNQRLRMQFVANGLSLNGSQVRLFQTQASDNTQHNQSLGMANIIRLNTNDNPSTLKISDSETSRNAKAIRLSTAAIQEGTVATPALDKSFAPIFNDQEGLYLYSPNLNLVLGNMYQPFVLGSEGNNIILEVTRIPNVPEIYSQIYTFYNDTDKDTKLEGALTAASFKGSTCNVAYCGSNLSDVKAGTSTIKYQGTNATHSSISIGSVTRDPTTNLLKANTDSNATGVVFRGPSNTMTNLGSAVIDGVMIQHLKFKTTGL